MGPIEQALIRFMRVLRKTPFKSVTLERAVYEHVTRKMSSSEAAKFYH
jgi:ribosomal protein S21